MLCIILIGIQKNVDLKLSLIFGMVEDPHRADGKQQRWHEVLTKNEIKFSFLGSETTFTGWLTSSKLNCVLYTFISRQQLNEIE